MPARAGVVFEAMDRTRGVFDSLRKRVREMGRDSKGMQRDWYSFLHVLKGGIVGGALYKMAQFAVQNSIHVGRLRDTWSTVTASIKDAAGAIGDYLAPAMESIVRVSGRAVANFLKISKQGIQSDAAYLGARTAGSSNEEAWQIAAGQIDQDEKARIEHRKQAVEQGTEQQRIAALEGERKVQVLEERLLRLRERVAATERMDVDEEIKARNELLAAEREVVNLKKQLEEEAKRQQQQNLRNEIAGFEAAAKLAPQFTARRTGELLTAGGNRGVTSIADLVAKDSSKSLQHDTSTLMFAHLTRAATRPLSSFEDTKRLRAPNRQRDMFREALGQSTVEELTALALGPEAAIKRREEGIRRSDAQSKRFNRLLARARRQMEAPGGMGVKGMSRRVRAAWEAQQEADRQKQLQENIAQRKKQLDDAVIQTADNTKTIADIIREAITMK